MTFRFKLTMLAQHLAIVGRTGSGKTYAAKGAVEMLLSEGRRVCIIDPTGVWYGLRSSKDGQHAGWPVVVFGGAHADVPISEQSGAAVARILAEKNLPAIVDLSEMLIGARHRFVTDFAEALYRHNRTPLHLVLDEADEMAPQNPLPETKRMLHHIDRIVRRGRVRGFRVMMITQRPAVLHKNLLTQANMLVAMRLTSPQDRAALKAWIEGQADVEQGKAVIASLPKLQRGEGWVWAPEIDMLERVTFPHITTFDSGREPDDSEPIVPTKLATVDLGEITASLAAIEAEPTVKELQADIARLRKQLNGAAPAQVGHTDAQVQALIAAALGQLQAPLAEALEATDRIKAGAEALRVPLAAIMKATLMVAGLPRPTGPLPDARTMTFGPAQIAEAQRRDKARDTANALLGGPDSAGHVQAEGARKRETARMLARPVEGVTAPQQRILNAIAQLHAFGVASPAKPMIAAHAGASPKSSGFANNLGALRVAGFIEYPGGGTVALTSQGHTAAPPPDRAPTLEELHDSWMGVITVPQQRILRVLIERHPMTASREQLAELAGASPASSGYANNLGALRTLGLVDYPSRGAVQATALLFPTR